MTESVRDALVRAGVELIDETGTHEIGLRVIARRAGVSHGAPRHWFPTYRSLLAAVAEVGLRDLIAVTRNAGDSVGDDRSRALSAALAYVDFATSRPAMFTLIFRHDLLADSGRHLREVSRPFFHWWTLLVASGEPTESGKNTESTELRAARIWTNIHGIAVLHATGVLGLIVPEVDVRFLISSALSS